MAAESVTNGGNVTTWN